MYHTQSQSSSFPMVLFDEEEMYSSTSASVDCTLSLATPSTRLTNHVDKKRSSCISNFGWNILPSKHTPPPPPPASAANKAHRGGNNVGSGGDPLLARRCANCDTTSTPLWRNGPRGPKSLCNACGIRYKKEERRATAAAASSNAHIVETQHGSWAQHHKTACYSSPYGNEYRFMENDVVDNREPEMGGGSNPFMSWRFNVTDGASLIHDFTR